MIRRSLHVLMSLSLLLGTGALVTATAGVAQAIGAPVMIDDFSGTHGGTRTITPLPLPGELTTAPGTFEEDGGLATIHATGDGNGAAGMRLSYAMNNVDLTSEGNNTQFFLEFGSIQRLPVQVLGETAASITIQVTDADGTKGVYNTGIANVIGFNVVLNFNCSPGQTACFTPQPDFTDVTNVTVEIRYPTNYDSVGQLTTVLDQIRTTPTGGIAPSAPSPHVTAPGSTVYGSLGDTVTFDVAFTSTTGPAAVTHDPPSSIGLRPQDVTTRGTAGGRNDVAVSGGPATYQVTLGPITSTGTLGIDIPADVVTDVWGQDNIASTSTPTVNFQVAVPPVLDTANPTPFLIGQNGSYQFTSSGLPEPTFELVGSLPDGLSLSGSGALTGTPAPGTSGTHTVQVRATNVAGSDLQSYTLTVPELPSLVAPTSVNFDVGTPNSFDVSFAGYPLPTLTSSGLPTWLTRTNNGPGSATFSGTAPASAVGDTQIQFTATNVAGQAQQTLGLHVEAISTSVEVTTDRNPADYGEGATATAVVAAPAPVSGSIQFTVDGADLGDPVQLTSGTATSDILTDATGDALAAGDHTIGAVFVPSSPSVLASSGSTLHVVAQAQTRTVLEIRPDSVQATVTARAPGQGTPTGTVTFFLAGEEIGEAELDAGVANLVVDVPNGDDAALSAEYSGDANFTSSSGSKVRRDPSIDASLTSAQPRTRFGWYGAPVTVEFYCLEGSAPLTEKCPADVVLDRSDADAVVERTIHAEDGGIATVVKHVRLDLDEPNVRVTGVKNGATYTSAPAKPRCVASDRLSGVASCTITRERNGQRVHVRAVATDKAGNTATVRGSYRVLANVVKGAPYRDGFFVVRAGQSYRLVVVSESRPRYFYATPWPQIPSERGPKLDRVGKQRWAIRISITDAMAARRAWNVGVEYGGDLHVVRLRIK